MLVRMTLLSEIELIHFSVLSSRDLNYHNDIQLFLQQFEKFRVYCVTNWHYKVLGTKQTSEWHFTHLRSQCDSLLFNCNSVYELCVKYCPRTISLYSLQYIWESFWYVLQSSQTFVYKPMYSTQYVSIQYPLVQHVLSHTTDSSTYELNKFYECTYVHLCLFHSKLSNIQHERWRLCSCANGQSSKKIFCMVSLPLNLYS